MRTEVLGISDEHQTTSEHLQQTIPVGNLWVFGFVFLFCFVSLLSVPPFFFFLIVSNPKM